MLNYLEKMNKNIRPKVFEVLTNEIKMYAIPSAKLIQFIELA